MIVARLTRSTAQARAYHRIQWRQRDKERMLRTSTNFTLLGLSLLTVAIASTIFVVTDVLYDTAWAVVTAIIASVVFALCWFVLPTSRRVQNGRDSRAGT
jgi:VIT1/CCC1 family predicted Fe2+/Mn2+ transporter